MANEQQRANVTLERGRQAAKMPHEQAKKYIASSANVDKSYEGVETETALTSRKQMTEKALGSFKQGGTVPKTGTYKLHKGETVVATDPTHARENISAAKAKILRSEQSRSSGDMAADLGRKAEHAEMIAHGANGNMVRRGSGALAPHDKDH